MLFDFFLHLHPPAQGGEFLAVGARQVPIVFVRNPRSRRYVLRLRRDGVARVTVPRGGSISEARKFAERNRSWLERQLQKAAASSGRRENWGVGTEFLFRGEIVRIEACANGESGLIRFGTEILPVADHDTDLRAPIQQHLWKQAAKEFPPVVLEFAARHQLTVKRVTVRDQRSRWGSCSRRGTISLNWRLIQAPPFVRDYLILHELAHLREMNHSTRFWREVENLCPDYRTAELWLRKHSSLLN